VFKRPAQREQGLHACGLVQLAFDDRDQFLALLIHLILGVEQGTPLLVALGFERLDLLLPGQLFLQRQGGRGGAAGLLDLAVDFLDFPLQADFQVVGPAVELVGLGLEEAGVALGYVALNGGLAIWVRASRVA
jgi:hypothetical protein